MTANELQAAIGKPAYYVAGDLKFLVTVKDAKMGWGKPRFLIQPVAGHGEKWVEFSSIEPVQAIQPSSTNTDVGRVAPAKRLMVGGFGYR